MPGDRSHNVMFRIVGLSRSGNHAIIDWVLNQLPGRWTFLNCVEPKTNPLLSARPRDDGRCFLASDPGLAPAGSLPQGPLPPQDHVVFSQEDTFLAPALGPAATARQEAGLGAAAERRDIIILRDPFNLFASRRRFGLQWVTERTTLRIWKQHARACLGERRYGGGPVLPILYDAWLRDGDYRRATAEALDLPFREPDLNRVAPCGGGSSFDGYAFDGQAARMNLLDRWRHYAEDPSFWALFDAETQGLARRLFGPLADRILGQAPIRAEAPASPPAAGQAPLPADREPARATAYQDS